ncbi:MAG TPA: hypothetical protein VMV49_04895 [Candidatus Deferrimicrobium sp.]|nr:hypothetical protein [Candidatus Deferrimicrobium sp.]
MGSYLPKPTYYPPRDITSAVPRHSCRVRAGWLEIEYARLLDR